MYCTHLYTTSNMKTPYFSLSRQFSSIFIQFRTQTVHRVTQRNYFLCCLNSYRTTLVFFSLQSRTAVFSVSRYTYVCIKCLCWCFDRWMLMLHYCDGWIFCSFLCPYTWFLYKTRYKSTWEMFCFLYFFVSFILL